MSSREEMMFTELLPPGVMSLTQLNMAISNAVYSSPALMGAWVAAELSDLRINGGHCYIELIEKNPTGQTVAKLRATIWQSTFTGLRRKFYQATGRDIATGLKVMLRGNVSHHAFYGLSFNVTDIDPSFTLGDMERLRREILFRLEKEGILNRNKQMEMPIAPQRIAVISAEGAAGYGDFMNQIEPNPEGFVFYTKLFPAIMQGDRVSISVREALEKIESTIDLWDCVVIARGGGATTDLNGFDDYELARAVATFHLPVIVGIGHERDRTVLDEIAHTRVKTPTAAGQFLLNALREAEKRSENAVDRIMRYVGERINGEQQRLANFMTLLPAVLESRFKSAQAILDKETARIPLIVDSRISNEKSRLESVLLRLRMGVENKLTLSRNNLEKLQDMVNVLSPSNTLKRGYSITRINGKAVTASKKLKEGDVITTEFHEGTVDSRVTGIH